MTMLRLAHVSDLHLGRIKPKKIKAIETALSHYEVDHVVATGDITDGGSRADYAVFQEIFRHWIKKERLTVVPGNHDRLGQNCGSLMMMGRNVAVTEADGLYIIQIDSTAAWNHSLLAAHGDVPPAALQTVLDDLGSAPSDSVVVVALHHHPIKLPGDNPLDTISGWLGLPYAAELSTGNALIETAQGRADLILHGHRHTPSSLVILGERNLTIANAGCTPAYKKVRMWKHKNGKIKEERWVNI